MKWLQLIFLGMSFSLYPCTSILVTKGASADGSVIVTHSDDDELKDPRMMYVPAQDHEIGSKRPVYFDPTSFFSTPVRYAGKDRGPAYDNPCNPPMRPLGYIDQIAHTYAYFDANYGIMNEHQLMIGETTAGAKYVPREKEGERIFYSGELSRVALERCTKAREAVKLIGSLIDTYGYYGTGEVLLIGDKEEGWVVEMCAGTSERSRGLWVAKKVPDGEVFVSVNEFRIREIDPNDPDMMFSKNLFDELAQSKWWNPKKGKLDWLKAVSYGESRHPYYDLRRLWRIFCRITPSANYSPWVKDGFTKDYPFSVKPDSKLSVNDVMALHRDHYEGTQFDLTKGLAAGPFGNPYRYYGDYDGHSRNVLKDKKMWGAWERPISVYYTGYTTVNQARNWLPDPIGGICWFGYGKPYLTCFVPFYAGVFGLPESFQNANTLKYDRSSAYWTFNFVANWAGLKYSYMKKDILARQAEIEKKEFAEIAAIDAEALERFSSDPGHAQQYLTQYCLDHAQQVVRQWRDLSEMLIVKYNDGYVNIPDLAQSVGYPEEWLKKVKYDRGPKTYEKP
jgi:dipeptidase